MNQNKSKLLCLIVDDEQPAQWVLTAYLKDVPQLELVGCAFDAVEALQFLEKYPVDVLFLDINMPGLTGFDLLNTLQNQPMVVFTTAFTNYALNSFEYNVVDYLVKPITRSRFIRAVERIMERVDLNDGEDKNETDPKYAPTVTLIIDRRKVTISVLDILYVQSIGNYVRIFLKQKTLIAHINSRKLMERLPPDTFIRIHKSFLINKFEAQSFTNDHIEISGKKIPLGISYKQIALTILNGAKE
jgi:DNA-binding LytR/AlgR family response regulator